MSGVFFGLDLTGVEKLVVKFLAVVLLGRVLLHNILILFQGLLLVVCIIENP